MDITQKLLKAGMQEKEARVYITLLKMGTQPASLIAKTMKIPRSTASFYLEELRKKGIVGKSKKGNMFLYFAESPEALLVYLQHKKSKEEAKIREQMEYAKNLLPELHSFRGHSPNRPKIYFYEGREGIEKIYEDTLTSSETLRSFASIDDTERMLPEYFPEYYKRRAEKNIYIRSVLPNTKAAQKRMKKNKEEKRESVLIDAKKYPFTSEIQLYDNKVSVVSWKEKLGILIESHEIYKALGVMFELAFLEAKRQEKTLKNTNKKEE